MAKRFASRLVLFVVFLSTSLSAQDNVLTPYNIFKIRQVFETSVSPDGKHIAYTLTLPRPFTDQPGADYRELHVMNVATGQSRPFITGTKTVGTLSWTPDSRSIAFLSSMDNQSRSQVYTISIEGGSYLQATEAKTSVGQYAFSPDGKTIAYTATEPQNPADKKRREMGFNAEVYEENVPDLNLYVADPVTKIERRLTTGISVFDFVWSPDGTSIAAAVAEKNLVDHEYMFSRIHLINPLTGQAAKLVDNPGKLGQIAWSPDGKKIAFISAVDVNDSRDGSIFVADVPNAKPFAQLKNYSKGFEGTVQHVEWVDDQTLVYFSHEGVDGTLRRQNLTQEKGDLLMEPGTVSFGGFNMKNGLLAFCGHTPTHPRELYTFDLATKTLTRRTTTNDWLKTVRLAKQEKLVYKAKDGLEITGVLIYPLDYQQGTRYPLIVDIHGGPEASYQNDWVTGYGNWGQIAAARGYFVFMPNYRASTGRGVEYARMGLGDLAGKEFQDVLDGIDHLVGKGYVDKNKVGIGGGSYGGYYAAWGATKHTDRFAASVVFVGVSNQISKRNTTDIPYEDYYVHWGIWTHENFEKVYDRSPVKWVKDAHTPTLILHGKEDPRVHPSQSLELYRSLKVHGKAPVRLVWYPGEGHGNRRNPARLDYAIRTMEWFDYYLKGNNPKNSMPPSEIDYKLNDGK